MRDREIRIDLRHDLAQSIRAELILSGYSQDSVNRLSSDDAALIRASWSIRRRWVSRDPRTIRKAKGFSCPPEHSLALSNIEQVIRNGDDLTPYLSARIIHLRYHDPLLNDWGIHHLHLGTKIATSGKNRGFVQRTNELLYCYFTDAAVHFIDVRDHRAFESRSLIETMHKNWPDEIAQFKLHGTTGTQLTDVEIRAIRRKRMIHVAVMDDGTCYMPIGGGVMTSGDNAIDVIDINSLLNWFKRAEETVVGFIREERDRGRRHLHPIKLRLCVVNGKYCVEDICNGDLYVIRDDAVSREPLARYKKASWD